MSKIEKTAKCLKGLSNPIRLAILCNLKEDENQYQVLEEAIDTSQSNNALEQSIISSIEDISTGLGTTD